MTSSKPQPTSDSRPAYVKPELRVLAANRATSSKANITIAETLTYNTAGTIS